jgi:nucleotide-binding universal stress UspA family protein
MIDVIAVGTDGSATAEKAVEYARELAAGQGAELLILSVFGKAVSGVSAAAMSAAWVPPTSLENDWQPQEAERVERLLAEAKQSAEAQGLKCRTAAGDGEPAEVLIGLAEKHGADLLVIGNRGMQRRLLGSVPNTITHRARCSVLIVKTT